MTQLSYVHGTTGFPKGATLSHHNILNKGLFIGGAMKLTEHDRVCIPVPLYHCFGMVIGNLGCLTHGAAMVYPSEGTGMMADIPCPIEVMKRACTSMHLSEIVIGYGMTETSPASFESAIDDSLERRVSTVGRVLPHVEAKIVDDEEKTGEAIDMAGWMHTGDLATIDAEGYCNIVGRIKDMVIRGGENVYPREIEEFLYRHPKIQDVQVIGIPDERYGEELCAWVRLRDGENATAEEIRAFCEGQIAHCEVARYVKFADGFPMTVTGKIQKFMMRQRMIDELGLSLQKTA
jgi:fatty-acyl-CoA synthase